MPRTASVSSFESVLHDLGRQIGEHIAAGITQAMQHGGQREAAAGDPSRAEPPAAQASARACLVPGCDRNQKTRGRCASHYGKALRLKLDTNTLGAATLRTLGADGRAARFARK